MLATKVTDRVSLIDTLGIGERNAIAAYVVRGAKTALIDCGHASSHENVLRGLGELGILPSEVDYLVPTHVHLDHAGGTGHLLRRMKGARVIAHERGVPHLVDPTRLVESATKVFGEELISRYGRPLPIDPERITAVGKEYHLDLGGVGLTLLHTPGHAPHQVSVLVEEEHMLVSADAVGIVLPMVPTIFPTTPPPSLDPEELSRSVERLSQTDPKTVLAPHYGVHTDVDHVFEETKKKTREWVELGRAMHDRHLSLDEMADEFAKRVASEAKMRREDLPWSAGISIRASAMGILHYIEKTSGAAKT
jgi:glyoxylase-like metal-dependent hydrolase (beta-lactamase superfamily II)